MFDRIAFDPDIAFGKTSFRNDAVSGKRRFDAAGFFAANRQNIVPDTLTFLRLRAFDI
jgi:hypothetical protein